MFQNVKLFQEDIISHERIDQVYNDGSVRASMILSLLFNDRKSVFLEFILF